MNRSPVQVAYADDHTLVRESVTTILNSYGNVNICIEANNGRELIDKIAASDRLPDVVILDINMPVMNGFETQQELMYRWPELKTLVVTVHPSELFIIRMIMSGAKGYLLKSVNSREIERAILQIHREGIYHSDATRGALKAHRMKLPHFTERELQVLKYCCTNMSYAEIAHSMETTTKSVEGLKDSLFKKLQVSNRTTLALYAVQLGMVTLEPVPEGIIKYFNK